MSALPLPIRAEARAPFPHLREWLGPFRPSRGIFLGLVLSASSCSDDLETDPYARWTGTYEGLAMITTTNISDTVTLTDSLTTTLVVAKGPGKHDLVVLGDTLTVRTDGGYEGHHALASFESFRLAFFPTDSVRVSYLNTDGTTTLAYQFRGKKQP